MTSTPSSLSVVSTDMNGVTENLLDGSFRFVENPERFLEALEAARDGESDVPSET